jgi:hypothetical protein
MKRFILLTIYCLSISGLSAQVKNNHFSAALHIAGPVFSATGNLKGVLLGASLQKQWKWGAHIAATTSVGYHYFSGTIHHTGGQQEKDFAVIPLLAGLRYYMKNKWYAAFETGVNMKAHSNAATKFTLVPSAGILWPVGKKAIDLGIQFSTVPMGYGFPEQKLLQRGGYSFLGIRAAWVF